MLSRHEAKLTDIMNKQEKAFKASMERQTTLTTDKVIRRMQFYTEVAMQNLLRLAKVLKEAGMQEEVVIIKAFIEFAAPECEKILEKMKEERESVYTASKSEFWKLLSKRMLDLEDLYDGETGVYSQVGLFHEGTDISSIIKEVESL